ncbi:hypothetical protein ACLKA7_015684 [Drosophila subpalustris]
MDSFKQSSRGATGQGVRNYEGEVNDEPGVSRQQRDQATGRNGRHRAETLWDRRKRRVVGDASSKNNSSNGLNLLILVHSVISEKGAVHFYEFINELARNVNVLYFQESTLEVSLHPHIHRGSHVQLTELMESRISKTNKPKEPRELEAGST